MYVLTFAYLGIGVWAAIWARPSYQDEREWLAVVPIVMLFWAVIAVALIGARLFYEVRTWWRWGRKA